MFVLKNFLISIFGLVFLFLFLLPINVNALSQVVTVDTHAPAIAVYGSTFPVSASSDMGLIVDITTTGGCSINSGTVTMTSGTVDCVIHYNQAGDGVTYASVPEILETTIASRSPLTITADSKSKEVGSPDPDLTYQITNGVLVGSDTITGALTRDVGETVGTYAINQGTLDAGSNYLITYLGSNLSVVEVPPSVASAPPVVSGGGGVPSNFGGGGGGGGFFAPQNFVIEVPFSATTASTTEVSTTTEQNLVGQVLGVSIFNFTKPLSFGSKGNDVKELQKRLLLAGVYNSEITGYFGPLTRMAVRIFQKNNGLESVGSVGPKTRAILNKKKYE